MSLENKTLEETLNFYEILGVDKNATTEEMKQKFRTLALKVKYNMCTYVLFIYVFMCVPHTSLRASFAAHKFS